MTAVQLVAHRYLHALTHQLHDAATHLAGAARAVAGVAWRRVRTIRREHILWGTLIVLAVAFVLVLLFEPTGAGRGGR
jgi:hypothetical protein